MDQSQTASDMLLQCRLPTTSAPQAKSRRQRSVPKDGARAIQSSFAPARLQVAPGSRDGSWLSSDHEIGKRIDWRGSRSGPAMASWSAFLYLLPAPRPVRGAISLAGISADQDNIRRAFKKIRFQMIADNWILLYCVRWRVAQIPATNQKVGSSSPPGRAISLNRKELEESLFTFDPLATS
jgi:hypothetical protein